MEVMTIVVAAPIPVAELSVPQSIQYSYLARSKIQGVAKDHFIAAGKRMTGQLPF